MMPEYHYTKLHDILRGLIIDGTYRDGDQLPTEAVLGKTYGVSRVTVRKALDLLKRDQIVRSVRGSGTVVTCRAGGYRGSLSTIVLIAPVDEAFFSTFYTCFDKVVYKKDILVVLKCNEAGEFTFSIDFYRPLLDRGIRDVILWPSRGALEINFQSRLRGIGVNLVFLDHVEETPYADCVSLDNDHAIKTIFKELVSRDLRRIHYVGLESNTLTSVHERHSAFLRLAGAGTENTRFEKGAALAGQIQKLVTGLSEQGRMPEAFLCENSEIGTMVSQSLHTTNHQEVIIASIGDEVPHLPKQNIMNIVFPTKEIARCAYDCLNRQNELGDSWKAQVYKIKGKLKVSFQKQTSRK